MSVISRAPESFTTAASCHGWSRASYSLALSAQPQLFLEVCTCRDSAQYLWAHRVFYIGLHLVGSGDVAAGCPCADKRNTEACGEERKFRGFLSKAKGEGKGAFFVAHYHEFPY